MVQNGRGGAGKPTFLPDHNQSWQHHCSYRGLFTESKGLKVSARAKTKLFFLGLGDLYLGRSWGISQVGQAICLS